MSATPDPADARPVQAAADYDVMVDWTKRLAREMPLFEALFAEHGVRSVIDVGTGTGMLPIALAERGFAVTGVDPSAEMLAQARVNAERVGAAVAFVPGGFGDLAGLGLGPADAVLSTGNALPHVDGAAGLAAAFADFAAVLRPGGVLVLHLLNHERLLAARPRMMPPALRDGADATRLYAKLLTYEPADDPERIVFEFVTAVRPVPAPEGAPALGWTIDARANAHTALPWPRLDGALGEAGFVSRAVYGDHARKPYERAVDESIVVVAVRG
jgi:SAM-dependent methyltransferase